MIGLRQAIAAGIAALFLITLPPASGGDKGSGKVRGRNQESERSRRLLVVYPKNRASQAREAAREAGLGSGSKPSIAWSCAPRR